MQYVLHQKMQLIAEVQSNSPYTPVSEESKHIRPDIQNPTARKGNSSSNIKNFPQVTPQQVQSISIQQARRIQLRALSIKVQAGLIGGNLPIPWWSSPRWQEMCVHCFFFFKKNFAYRQKRIPCDRREVSTAHRTAQTLLTQYFLARGSRPSYRLKTES